MADILYLMGFKDTPAIGDHRYDPHNFHVTVLDHFSLPDTSLHAFIKNVESMTRWFGPIPLKEEGMKWFGLDEDIPVMSLKHEADIMNLHHSLCDLLAKFNGKMKTPEYNGESYNPHVSYLEDESILWDMDSFSLIHHRSGFGVDVVNRANFSL